MIVRDGKAPRPPAEPKPRRKAVVGSGGLSPREAEALGLLAKGFTHDRIAERMGLRPCTVRDHFKHIYRKLQISNQAEAGVQAVRLGLVRTE